MAVAIPFDTLDYARKLESAGVPAAQAELQATALGEALAKAVAAPADLVMLESRLGARIGALDAKIEAVESRLGARIGALDAKIEAVASRLGARIDALDAKIEAVESRLGARIDALDVKIEAVQRSLTARIDALDAKIEQVRNELRLELGGRIDRLAASVDTLKWMFGFMMALNIAILVRLLLIRS
ncbi:MAG TPA: hypothetical protein VF059_00250 [Casimicrobiaceae bacterium]